MTGYAGTDKGRNHRWVVLCDCGKTKERPVLACNLSTGATQSCGCLRAESNVAKGKRRQKPGNAVAVSLLYAGYRNDAMRKHRVFNIGRDLFERLILADCTYCGASPSNYCKPSRNREPLLYSGVDRVDSTRGYEPENVVSCCKLCNYCKRTMPLAVFIEWASRVSAIGNSVLVARGDTAA